MASDSPDGDRSPRGDAGTEDFTMPPGLEEDEDRDRFRCFVAVFLDFAALEELQVVQRLLRRQLDAGVRWTQPEQMHLTLHFLGEVDAADLDPLVAALEGVASGFIPLELCVQGLGVFPERGRPRVIWAGLGGDLEALGKLQRGVSKAVAGFGDRREPKEFHPHLTLGRAGPDSERREDLPALLHGLAGPRPIPWLVRELTLMRSDLLPSGARYTVINTVALGSG